MMQTVFAARRLEVPCRVDIAQTAESLHAHVELTGAAPGPGDTVLVHGAPTGVAYGAQIVCTRRATILRAGALRRLGSRLAGYLQVTTLLEVSFSSCRTSQDASRRRQ